MANNVNGNNWSSWANNLDASCTAINTINQQLKILNGSSVTYQQYSTAYTQIQAALNNVSSLNSPLGPQFISGAATALGQMNPGSMSIVDPITGQSVSVTDVGFWEAQFTMKTSYTNLLTLLYNQSGSRPSWMPGENATVTVNGVSKPMDEAIGDVKVGQTVQIQYTLPNGDPITFSYCLTGQNECSIQIDGSIQDFASSISLNSVDTSALENFISKY